MKAKCPHCNDGCARCQRGYIEVSFPEGPGVQLWLKVCRVCGAEAGGCFSGPGLPEPCVSPYAVCPACGGQDIELVLTERTP